MPNEVEVSSFQSLAELVDFPCSLDEKNDENIVSSSTNQQDSVDLLESLVESKNSPLNPAESSIKVSKYRRRIMLLEDDEDDEASQELELSDKEKCIEEQENPRSDEDSETDSSNAKKLLKSAVIIRGPNTKKRILDSDEDEDVMKTSVDDIGLLEDNSEILSRDEQTEGKIILADSILLCSDEKALSKSRFSDSDLESEAAEIPNDEYFGINERTTKLTVKKSQSRSSNVKERPARKRQKKYRYYDKYEN